MKNSNGKGSKRRPTDESKVRENWDKIFGKPVSKAKLPDFLGEGPVYNPKPDRAYKKKKKFHSGKKKNKKHFKRK